MKELVYYDDLIEMWEEETGKVWFEQNVNTGKNPSIFELAIKYGYNYIPLEDYFVHNSVEFAQVTIGNDEYTRIRVTKINDKFFMKTISSYDDEFNSAEIEISRVTYCALLSDNKLVKSPF